MKKKLRMLGGLLCAALLSVTGCGAGSVGVDAASFSMGRMDGNTYINEFFDIQYTVDEDWTVLDEAQRLEIYNMGCVDVENALWLESMEAGEVAEILEKQDMEVPLMVAFGDTGSVMIYAAYEMADPTDSAFHAAYMNEWKEEIKRGLSGPGHENVTVKLSETTFLGDTVDCIDGGYTREGIPVFQKTVPVYEGTYRINVMTLSYVSEEHAQWLLDGFGTGTEPAIISEEPQPVKPEVYEASFVAGSVKDGIYTNEALGLQCELGELWEFDQIADYDDASINEALQQGKNLLVMDAESPEGIVSIKIMKEDMVLNSGGPLDGREELFAYSYEQKVTEELTGVYDFFETKRCDVEFMGAKPFGGFDTTISHQGIDMYQRNLFIRKNGFFGTIMISGLSEESVQAVMDCFTTYER